MLSRALSIHLGRGVFLFCYTCEGLTVIIQHDVLAQGRTLCWSSLEDVLLCCFNHKLLFLEKSKRAKKWRLVVAFGGGVVLFFLQ